MATIHRQGIFRLALYILAFALCAFFSISGESLWIDEAESAAIATRSSWSDFLSRMATNRGSDLQMPFYMVLLWLWEKVAGHTEFALRSLNFAFLAAALVVVLRYFRAQSRVRLVFAVLTCVSPFIWFYMNEARPYILQFCGASFVMVGTLNRCLDPGKDKVTQDGAIAMIGICILAGASLLSVIYLGAWMIALMFLFGKDLRELLQPGPIRILIAAVALCLLCLAGYYSWTLFVGARASSVGRTNAISCLFIVYDVLGFSGLGAGRLDLRTNGAQALRPYLSVLTGFGILTMVVSTWGARLSLRSHARGSSLSVLAAACIVPVLAILILGYCLDFRVLSRHIMPVIPFWFALFAYLLCLIWSQGNAARVLVVSYILVLAASALSLRLLERHDKDDYRSASIVAREYAQRNSPIWWSANEEAASYYGLDGYVNRCLFFTSNREEKALADLPFPSVVILSKPDIYDESSTLRAWLAKSQFVPSSYLAGFVIYRRE